MFEDDSDNIALENAHPAAQLIMKDEFFYSVVDGHAPFGNDDGWEVLYALKEWLPDNIGVSKKQFIDAQLSGWDYPAFNYLSTDIEEARAFARSSPIGLRLLMGIDQAVIATGFAQLYLEGKIDRDLKGFVETVLQRQLHEELLAAWGVQRAVRQAKLQQLHEALHAA